MNDITIINDRTEILVKASKAIIEAAWAKIQSDVTSASGFPYTLRIADAGDGFSYVTFVPAIIVDCEHEVIINGMSMGFKSHTYEIWVHNYPLHANYEKKHAIDSKSLLEALENPEFYAELEAMHEEELKRKLKLLYGGKKRADENARKSLLYNIALDAQEAISNPLICDIVRIRKRHGKKVVITARSSSTPANTECYSFIAAYNCWDDENGKSTYTEEAAMAEVRATGEDFLEYLRELIVKEPEDSPIVKEMMALSRKLADAIISEINRTET